MPSPVETPSAPPPALERHAVIRLISRWEQRWRQAADPGPARFSALMESLRRMDQAYAGLSRTLDRIQTGTAPLTARVFTDYRGFIEAQHKRNRALLLMNLDLLWPEEAPFSRRGHRTFASLREQTRQAWDQPPAFAGRAEERLHDILTLKKERDRHPVNTLPWRRTHDRLCRQLHDLLVSTLRAHQHTIRRRFQAAVYTASRPSPSSGGDSAEAVADWVAGFRPALPTPPTVSPDLLSLLHHGLLQWRLRLAAAGLAILLILGAVVYTLHQSSWDERLYAQITLNVQKFLGCDPASRKIRQKKDFFYQKILDIPENVHPQDIRRQLDLFFHHHLDRQPDGALYFAQNILPGFFLLLPENRIPDDLKARVLTAAGLLGEDLLRPLDDITRQYQDDLIRESRFRGQMLHLRRAFVERGVFPFMFITLKNDTPYLFLFAERIRRYLFFPAESLTKIGLDPQRYTSAFPLTAHVVRGDLYPFHERAGYFEGEFAIVFSLFAPKEKWTALHEFGHLIDQIRYKSDKTPLPRNEETHAVLFPLMFDENADRDPKDYLNNRLLPIIAARDPEDRYVQAVKGILNGMALALNEDRGTGLALISDRLEPDRIDAIARQAAGLSDEDLTALAIRLYRNPKHYLNTARPGEYRGVISNAEEVIQGTAGPPQGGFILSGYGSGEAGEGSRFLREGWGDDTGLDEGFNLAAFLRRLLSLVFSPNRHQLRASGWESALSALLSFLIIEAVFIGIHRLATPYRRRKFLGTPVEDIIDRVYNGHPWSDGQSSGGAEGERRLLKEITRAQGHIPEGLRARVQTFKAAAGARRRALMDALLTLAPVIPAPSRITNRAHDFLFWIPFLGPWLARHPGLFPAQQAFHAREQFNALIARLTAQVTAQTDPEEFRHRLSDLLRPYNLPKATDTATTAAEKVLAQTEQLITHHLNNRPRMTLNRRPNVRRRSAASHTEDGDFDRLDVYTPGDDIKRIDWNATARAPHQDPKLRRYRGVFGTRIGFLMDLRALKESSGREKIARDFVRSLEALGENHELKELLLLMPDGHIRRKPLRLPRLRELYHLSERIWSRAAQAWDDYTAQQNTETLQGLTFYNPAENARYLQALTLGDRYQPPDADAALEKIVVHRLNIFMIGVTMERRGQIEAALGGQHERYHWA